MSNDIRILDNMHSEIYILIIYARENENRSSVSGPVTSNAAPTSNSSGSRTRTTSMDR